MGLHFSGGTQQLNNNTTEHTTTTASFVTMSSSTSRKRPHAVISVAKPKSSGVTAIKQAPGEIIAIPQDVLKQEFIQLFSDPAYESGISNSALKQKVGESKYVLLAPIINQLTSESRLAMSRVGNELFYTLVSDELASKFQGLDISARMVYQVIEKSGNMGIWTKDIRMQTNCNTQQLNKILKALETRQLIKPVKSVTAKAKKLYMLFNLTPSKELTGGPWYTELEFDHEFISELRTFLMHMIRKMNGGKGVTLTEIREKMIQANVSRVQLSVQEVKQLVQTLVYDNHIEEEETEKGESVFVASRRITPMCEFKCE